MCNTPLALFRCLTNGVYVIGVSHAGHQNAFTAAWVTQVSFTPLLLALSINPDHASYPLLKKSGIFTVNVLRQTQLDLARQFGTQSGRETDKLKGTRWRPGPGGAPVLLDALACLDCHITQTMNAGDHEIVLGEVVGGTMLNPGLPLGYAETDNLDGSADLYPPHF